MGPHADRSEQSGPQQELSPPHVPWVEATPPPHCRRPPPPPPHRILRAVAARRGTGRLTGFVCDMYAPGTARPVNLEFSVS